MRRLGHWIVLFALAWAATTAAYAAQAAMQPCAEAMRLLSVADCQPCAIGHAIPAAGTRMAESDDGPDVISVGRSTHPEQQATTDETRVGPAVRPPLALRVLYCRWLN